MMLLKTVFRLVLLLSFFAVAACQKDEPAPINEVSINILAPAADAVVANSANVTISVEITATEEVDQYELVLYPSGDDQDLILDVDVHEHGSAALTFEQTVDLSGYPAGQVFQLDVSACGDHDCEEKEEASRMFSIP